MNIESRHSQPTEYSQNKFGNKFIRLSIIVQMFCGIAQGVNTSLLLIHRYRIDPEFKITVRTLGKTSTNLDSEKRQIREEN
jgi:hypothetical protein